MSTRTVEKAILRTLAYADIFDYPLKEEEIWLWLLADGKTTREQDGKEEFKQALKKLLKTERCKFAAGFYFLPGREEIVGLRQKREKASVLKIKKAQKVVGILKYIPWVNFIGITGGLAQKNGDEEDDIDLFFITARKKLWLTRGLVVVILSLLGLYRRKGKIKDMICPNMLISEDALKMEPQDLFMAHEVAMMKPIFERDRTYQKFVAANLWAREFLPNAKKWPMVNSRWLKAKKNKKILHSPFLILHSAERLARGVQLWYMAKKKTTEIVSDTLIKFHPQDARKRVLQEYQKRLKDLRLS